MECPERNISKQSSPFETLLKSHFDTVVLLQICCIYSEKLFVRTPAEGCFWQYNQHLPIRIQQEIKEHEVKLASSKQKNKKR